MGQMPKNVEMALLKGPGECPHWTVLDGAQGGFGSGKSLAPTLLFDGVLSNWTGRCFSAARFAVFRGVCWRKWLRLEDGMQKSCHCKGNSMWPTMLTCNQFGSMFGNMSHLYLPGYQAKTVKNLIGSNLPCGIQTCFFSLQVSESYVQCWF